MFRINRDMNNVSISEAQQLIKTKSDLLILDVREKEEYEEGHIPGAVLIPAPELPARIEELREYQDKPVLVYCGSGARSPEAVIILLDNHFSEVYHLYEGFIAWEDEVEQGQLVARK